MEDPVYTKVAAGDDFPLLEKKYEQYVHAMNKLRLEGIDEQLLGGSSMRDFMLFLIPYGFIPLGGIMLYIAMSMMGITDKVAYGWNYLTDTYPAVKKPLGALLTIAVMGAFLYFCTLPMRKLGFLGGTYKKKDTASTNKTSEEAFFTQPMQKGRSYNSVFIRAGLVMGGTFGVLILVLKPLVGIAVFAFIAIAGYAWRRKERLSRPVIRITREGEISITYAGGKAYNFSVTDCKQVVMGYYDMANYSRVYQRPLIQAATEAVGGSTLVPYQLEFTGKNDSVIVLDLDSLRAAGDIFIEASEAEYFIALLLKNKGFRFSAHQLEGTIFLMFSGWEAQNTLLGV